MTTYRFLYWLCFMGFGAVGAFAQPKVENLGPTVNSEFNEINPLISPDGRTLFFARVSHPNNSHGPTNTQDIWYTQYDTLAKQWTAAQPMPQPLNREVYNCAYSVTPDGNTLLLKGAYNNGQYETRGFSISKRTANGWAMPQKLAIPDYEKLSKGLFDCGFLSADGKTLVMAFSEKRGSKEEDLYVSFRQRDGSWSRPLSLGSDVNTGDFTETTPFLAADGATLYFSSNRSGGQGSNDIWVVRRVDKTWQRWSKPQNLGPVINTDGYDAYYSVAASGEWAYMTTKKNSLGKGDIVRIKLRSDSPTDSTRGPGRLSSGVARVGEENATSPNTTPGTVALVSGRVIDQRTGQPIEARVVYEFLDDGTEAGVATSDPVTGEYKIVLPTGKRYSFRAIAPDFIAEGQNVDLTNADTYQEINGRELKLVPIEVGRSVRLNNIFFETGKAELRPESSGELDRIADILTNNPTVLIELGGHTDNVGGNEFNAKLSQDRADAVREYLIGKGIEPDRLASKGYGETRPVAANDSDDNRQRNRRVEFVITKK